MEKGWSGLPYYTIAEHYKTIFGEKVYKIPVSVVDDCPNRMGLKGMQTCSFCDVWGSAAREESFAMDLESQIENFKAHIAKKFNSKSFLVYFQAYTNTFTKVSQLRSNFDLALNSPDVKGFVLGTRPDCLSKSVLDLWQEYNQKSYVAVELGVQSFFDTHLDFMKRGHSASDSLKAIEKISNHTAVDLGIHLIFGSPNETEQQIIETAKICNELPITNIKLHNLHVLKNTSLETLYENNEFTPISFEVYRHRVQLFLEYLRPDIALHRLAAFASRWDELIAPEWTKNKMKTHQEIIDHLRRENSYQSKLFNCKTDLEMHLKAKRRFSGLPSLEMIQGN